jgi:hypothetical protein
MDWSSRNILAVSQKKLLLLEPIIGETVSFKESSLASPPVKVKYDSTGEYLATLTDSQIRIIGPSMDIVVDSISEILSFAWYQPQRDFIFGPFALILVTTTNIQTWYYNGNQDLVMMQTLFDSPLILADVLVEDNRVSICGFNLLSKLVFFDLKIMLRIKDTVSSAKVTIMIPTHTLATLNRM